MCLIALAWRRVPGLRLVLAGNRDEFHGRPTAPLHWWDSPRLLAGRDLQAGGTWLAVGEGGRFGAITNYRGAGAPAGAPSRGELVPAFVESSLSPGDYAAALARDAGRYAGFSLLVGDANSLAYFSNRDPDGPRLLAPGIYGLGNGLLDTPWPKLVRTRDRFGAFVANLGSRGSRDAHDFERLFELMRDTDVAPDHELPETGVDLALERLLSAPFIVGPDYGTRSTTVLMIDEAGRLSMVERRYAPDGLASRTERFLPAHAA